ncbi:AAA family ATPase [candidate division KSB1 bacterium]|nr:AAA family ATPase [candidate division KSB1 bacterium]
MQKKTRTKSLSLLKSLNPVQKQAVECTNGPSLILAGAGSGKTKVLTHKIAYLIDRHKVDPSRILALTFTNKAAREMKERIIQLIKGRADVLWCSTFHSSFARILRKNADRIGFNSNYAIYDEKDQLALIKEIIRELRLEHEKYTAKAVRSVISNFKNKLMLPEDVSDNISHALEEYAAEIYQVYQTRLRKNNAMDFDDLLLKTVELFQLYPDVLSFYQQRWDYILIDEYQDTNYPQYLIIKMLSAKHRNLSVVGDDDQSIYRWRGAEIRNILDFEQDFSDCTTFRLEQNYRSTGNILVVANAIIRHNSERMEKELWTKKGDGEAVSLLVNSTGEEEAYKIVAKIQEECQRHERNFSDFAILYRTNAQSRALEDGLRRNGIAYVIVGGIRFFERKEVKDILAYLRVVVNPLDEISLKRIINFPLRGIGPATIAKIEEYCMRDNLPFFEGLRKVKDIETISGRQQNMIYAFHQMISKYTALLNEFSANELAATLVDELGVLKSLKEEGTQEALSRRENIQELLTQINQFCQEHENPTLAYFLEDISLITDIDRWDDNKNAVTLMTLHAAKGLEFPVVFLAGLEDGIMPLSRSTIEIGDLEEERRLFYVGTTRAREKLYYSMALKRKRFGETLSGKRSRFLEEIEKDLLEVDDLPVYSGRHYPRSKHRTVDTFHAEQRAARKTNSLRKGALVKHPRFGKGVIRALHGDGEDLRADILFEEVGEKKVVIKYAKLEML